MKRLILLLMVIPFLFTGCQSVNEEPIEKHTLQLEYVDYTTRYVCMYDETMHKNVLIYYDQHVFKISLIDLLHTSSGAEFMLYYSGGNYYSI